MDVIATTITQLLEVKSTMLHQAVYGGHIETVKLLLDKGMPINKLGSVQKVGNKFSIKKITPLDMAVEQKDDDMIKLLRNHGGELRISL